MIEIVFNAKTGKITEVEIPDEPLPQKTAAEIQAELETAVQQFMDDTAANYGYGDENVKPLISACSYAAFSSVPKFQQEGQAFGEWRSLVWAKCYEIMGDVLAGKRAVPTVEELIKELPVLAKI